MTKLIPIFEKLLNSYSDTKKGDLLFIEFKVTLRV